MRQLSVAGVVVGLLALFLSSAALMGRSGGGDDLKADLEKLGASVSVLKGRIDSLEADVKSAAAKSGDEARVLTDLSARVVKAEAEAKRLGRAVADIPERPAAAGGEIDPERIRELVQAEMRAAAERFRGPGGGGPGAGGRPGGGQRPDAAASLRELGLSEEKVAKVTESEQKLRDEIGRFFRENRGGDRDAMRRKMQELHEKANEELAKSLTAEEMEKYRQWHDQQRQRGGRGDRGGRGGGDQPGQPARQPEDGAAF